MFYTEILILICVFFHTFHSWKKTKINFSEQCTVKLGLYRTVCCKLSSKHYKPVQKWFLVVQEVHTGIYLISITVLKVHFTTQDMTQYDIYTYMYLACKIIILYFKMRLKKTSQYIHVKQYHCKLVENLY